MGKSAKNITIKKTKKNKIMAFLLCALMFVFLMFVAACDITNLPSPPDDSSSPTISATPCDGSGDCDDNGGDSSSPPIYNPTPPPTQYNNFATFKIEMAGIDPGTGAIYNYLHRYNWRRATFSMQALGEEYSFNSIGGRIRGRGNSTWNAAATRAITATNNAAYHARMNANPPTMNPHFRDHWTAGNNPASIHMQKWPFRIRLDAAREMLGTNRVSRDWSFIANLSDNTQLRNEAAKILSRSLDGMDWQTTSRFVHVYWNGTYRGLYWMAEQLEVSNYNPHAGREDELVEGRVPLTYDNDPRFSEFFFELDLRADRINTDIRAFHDTHYRLSAEAIANAPVPNVDYFTVGGRRYDVRFPDGTRENGVGLSGNTFTRRNFTPAHSDYLRNFVQRVDAAIVSNNRNFAEISSLIDIDSFVDFYIVHEFFKNMDSGGLSTHKTIRGIGANRRLYLGPIWDFDLSAGNSYPSSTWGTRDRWNLRGGHGYRGVWAGYINRWYRNLLMVPGFFNRVRERFAEIRDNQIQDMIDEIASIAYYNEEHFVRNFDVHEVNTFTAGNTQRKLGRRTWTQSPCIQDIGWRTLGTNAQGQRTRSGWLGNDVAYRGNVEHLLNWFENRRDWMTQWLTYGSGTNTLPLYFD